MRHGQTEYNVQHLAQGWSDSSLTELGVRQVIEARDIIKNIQFDHVYSSDLSRSINTARIVTNDQYEIETDKRLRETHFGKFEAKPNYIKNLYILFHPFSEYRKVNGEKMIDSIQRYNEFIDEKYKENPNQTILIVGHGGVITNFIHNHCWRQLIRNRMLFLFTKNAGIHYIEYDGVTYQIYMINQ